MGTLINWQELSAEVSRDRRKGKRLALVFPIVVSGLDSSWRFFTERTKTVDISETGCRFYLKARPKPGDVVAIRLVSPQDIRPNLEKQFLFEIAWVAPEGDAWVVGASKLQPENIWHMVFPPSQTELVH